MSGRGLQRRGNGSRLAAAGGSRRPSADARSLVDRDLLAGAGALAEPALRTLDAIHVASDVALDPIEAFVTYEERQAAVVRLAGLRTMAPGV